MSTLNNLNIRNLEIFIATQANTLQFFHPNLEKANAHTIPYRSIEIRRKHREMSDL